MGDNAATTTRAQFWQDFHGPNRGYILELYEQYLQDPTSVDEETRALFDQFGNPADFVGSGSAGDAPLAANVPSSVLSPDFARRLVAATELVRNIRNYGHLAAHIDPLSEPTPVPILELAEYQLTEADLASIPASMIWPNAPQDVRTGLDAVKRLKAIYTGDLAYEFNQVTDVEERKWLDQVVESDELHRPYSPEEKRQLLYRLTEVESFEKFLHRTFAGQKRFSIEGVDAMVPMLDKLVELSASAGTHNVMIGMAHRGRLNVLAHILRKPYEKIFAEFHGSPNKDLVPSEGSTGINHGWTGDVKYHMGANRVIGEGTQVEVRITLANNPSHLEFVNPVIEGYTRAAQDDRTHGGAPSQDVQKAIAVQIHGDAAFPGEGVVAETLNLSRLRAYSTGGTIHIIANNHLGFTAEADEGRSTRYASDLAKGFEIPVVHVSADNPEACLTAIRLAHMYRERFHKDFLIDLIGYRRWGHNEGDDPSPTQPLLYKKISEHPTVRTLYANALKTEGVLSEQDAAAMEAEVQQKLKEAYARVGEVEEDVPFTEWAVSDVAPAPVSLEELKKINEALLTFPSDFAVYPKLKRILERRRNALDEGGKVDWALAESLAFSTILANGTPIRLTGQDSERGTFGHRHLVLHDVNTNKEFVPLQALPQAKASFAVYNSALSEAAVLGFEYGYSVYAKDALVMWEAQFGDFANTAQVLIDQFISAGISKWGQSSGLVLLLPHGYEGQGPEHSSARLERYLQLSAQNNWMVANVTTAAQYFHLLRLQAARLGKTARPLVIMTPKSLLRNQKAMSDGTAFSEGRFEPILRDTRALKAKDIKRLILCSGKVAVDLENAMEKSEQDLTWVAVARIEQLYPFPEEELQDVIAQYPGLKEIVWLQEEPENMGAWTYMQPKLQALLPAKVKLRYVGRPEQASPAEGHAHAHNAEQARILDEALQPTLSAVLQ
ncbi:2-oxoglutarate dehydrogenase E1 component [Alicyclobacillus pomorum]|uniref:2-oxoglutarate dehydrogenase E1 component n=1 Tax=Alicyclobacillus pomorum TaxID=204470 RepID=UPI0003FBA7A4|nr:2-oxoglutarate dehydrogenase E1 component [Alicyclobacillus pomorum]